MIGVFVMDHRLDVLQKKSSSPLITSHKQISQKVTLCESSRGPAFHWLVLDHRPNDDDFTKYIMTHKDLTDTDSISDTVRERDI